MVQLYIGKYGQLIWILELHYGHLKADTLESLGGS